METIRNRLIHQGSSIQVKDNVVKIQLNQTFPYQNEVIDILKALRQLVKIEAAFDGQQ
jgi:hypothetical protein